MLNEGCNIKCTNCSRNVLTEDPRVAERVSLNETFENLFNLDFALNKIVFVDFL